MNNGASPDAIEVARKLHDEFDADERFAIDWMTTEFVVKLRDPYERSRLYSILHVTFSGYAQVWSLAGQLSRVGLPETLAYDFASDCGALVGGKPSPQDRDVWEEEVELETFGHHYAECVALINRLADEIYKRRETEETPTSK